MSYHTNTLSHAIELQRASSAPSATSYPLLDYPPCLHLAKFTGTRLARFLPLTRSNLRMDFGKERGDRCMRLIVSSRKRSTR
jgi:hypothetical protein